MISCNSSYAFDPLSVPNNQVGVHILDTQEIDQAAKLVNSTGGDWGYVTIPIRINDRDYDKWYDFFFKARKLHLIPILRLATYPDGGVWVKPTVFDLVDFANFLNDMPWPTSNRYVILFNEVNRANEWGGGEVNPRQYATLLIDAKNIFKSRSADFFLLSAGLDMSAPNSSTSMDALQFYRLMTFWQPQWTKAIDGMAVHAYPNPGFSSSVYSSSRYGIRSYKYEPNPATLPLFITETGWIGQPDFYTMAFKEIWTDKNIVAVTPFVLSAGGEEFGKFSLTNSPAYAGLMALPKISGSPLLSNLIISQATFANLPSTLPFTRPLFIDSISTFLNRLRYHKITINGISLDVEIAATPSQRQKGLSSRSSLAVNTGMLFVFNSPDRYQFWMKDMNFPLDFIWIRNGRAVQLSTNIPSTQPPVILTPNQPVDQILEVPAGFIDKNGIKVGDEVQKEVIWLANLKVGNITHYYDKIGVAVVDLTASLRVGDRIGIKGSTDFTQSVDSLQVEHEQIQSAKSKDTVGLKVIQAVKPGDEVVKVS